MDIAIYTYIAHILLTDASPEPLEIRNQYIGLDELYEYGIVNASRHDPIINKPRRVGHVFSNDPHKASPVDEHRGLTAYGLMAPPDQHLHVTTEVCL